MEDNELYKRIAAKDFDIAICYYDPDKMNDQIHRSL